MDQLWFPYSDAQFHLLARIAGERVNGVIIDPRLANEILALHVLGVMQAESNWIRLKLHRYHTKQNEILLGIYDSMAPQAYAIETATQKEAFIAISLGFLNSLGVYFNIAFANPDLMQEYGDSQDEVWPRESNPNILDIAPRNAKRQALCMILIQMSIRFLVAHELTHVLHGHLRYQLTKSSPQSSYAREAVRELTEEEATRSQTLEMDADAGAILECVSDEFQILGPFDASRIPAVPKGSKQFFLSSHYVGLWMVAIYAVFRVLEDVRRDIPLHRSSHPRPMTRLLMTAATLDALFVRDGLHQARIELAEGVKSAINGGDKIARSLGLRHKEVEIEAEPIDIATAAERSTAYIRKLKEEWKVIRPFLEPLSTCDGKLAPAD